MNRAAATTTEGPDRGGVEAAAAAEQATAAQVLETKPDKN